MVFHDYTPNSIFSKHQNKAEIQNLDDSEVLISDMYFRPENLCSLNDLHSPEQSPWPQWPLEPHFNNKEILIMMFWSFLAPKLPMQVLFSWMHDHKSKFLLMYGTFSVRGCWGQPMLLFSKVVDETQMGKSRDYAARNISSKFSIFLPLRAISKKPYHYETPCNTHWVIFYAQVFILF